MRKRQASKSAHRSIRTPGPEKTETGRRWMQIHRLSGPSGTQVGAGPPAKWPGQIVGQDRARPGSCNRQCRGLDPILSGGTEASAEDPATQGFEAPCSQECRSYRKVGEQGSQDPDSPRGEPPGPSGPERGADGQTPLRRKLGGETGVKARTWFGSNLETARRLDRRKVIEGKGTVGAGGDASPHYCFCAR